MTTQNKAKWLRFLILILGGGTIYKLANLKDAFYVPMQEFMGLSHTEIGLLLERQRDHRHRVVRGGRPARRSLRHAQADPLGLIGTGSLGCTWQRFPPSTIC